MIWNLIRLYRMPEGDGGAAGTVTVIPPNPNAPASASGSLNLPAAGDGKAAPLAFTVPDAYRDKPYAKTIDSSDKLWSMLDGAQELIGKRPAGIPAPDAPQAEWDKFYEATGRPKTAAEYAFDYGKDDKGVPKLPADPKFDASIKEIMFKHGISAKQAVGLQKDFDGIIATMAKEKGLAVAQEHQDFDKMSADLFGAERDNVLANGKKLLTEHIKDPRLTGMLAKLPNEALNVVAAALHSITSKFIKPDSAPLNPPGSPGTGGAMGSKDAMHTEARRLMTLPEYTNSMHPDNPRILAQIAKLYQDADKMK